MNKHYFLKNSYALTIAPTENLHEYKIVERKNGTSFLFVQIVPSSSGLASNKASKVAVTIFVERKKSEQTLFFKKFIAP